VPSEECLANTLQHTATHCNTLRHTATHYNTGKFVVPSDECLESSALDCATTGAASDGTAGGGQVRGDGGESERE